METSHAISQLHPCSFDRNRSRRRVSEVGSQSSLYGFEMERSSLQMNPVEGPVPLPRMSQSRLVLHQQERLRLQLLLASFAAALARRRLTLRAALRVLRWLRRAGSKR